MILAINGRSFPVEMIFLLVLFVIILYSAYFLTNFLGKAQMNRYNNKQMKIIEVMSVSPQKTLQLIKVGEEYLLIAVSKNDIVFLKTVDKERLDETLLEEKGLPISFKTILTKKLSQNSGERDDEKK